MAAGMAMEGFVPYVNTIATFITRRCYEQVAIDLCLQRLRFAPAQIADRRLGEGYAEKGSNLAIFNVLAGEGLSIDLNGRCAVATDEQQQATDSENEPHESTNGPRATIARAKWT